jgi:hypothetical protein
MDDGPCLCPLMTENMTLRLAPHEPASAGPTSAEGSQSQAGPPKKKRKRAAHVPIDLSPMLGPGKRSRVHRVLYASSWLQRSTCVRSERQGVPTDLPVRMPYMHTLFHLLVVSPRFLLISFSLTQARRSRCSLPFVPLTTSQHSSLVVRSSPPSSSIGPRLALSPPSADS